MVVGGKVVGVGCVPAGWGSVRERGEGEWGSTILLRPAHLASEEEAWGETLEGGSDD